MTLTLFLAIVSLSAVVGFIVDAVGTVFATLRVRTLCNLIATVATGVTLGLVASVPMGPVLGGLAGAIAFLLIFALIAVQLIGRKPSGSDPKSGADKFDPSNK